jgi:hypothetical protein
MFRIFRLRVVKRWFRYNAIRKGLFARERPWLFVLGVGLLARQANKVLKRGVMPVRFSEKLEPGTSLVITHLAPTKSRGKRR